jgi:fructose-specific phosphotransferase system IIA component
MLFIVMHNDQRYLDRLTELATQEEINDFTIVREKDIGLQVMGASASCVFSQGHVIDAYQKAFVVVIKGKEKLLHFMDVIERDPDLRLLNMHSRGFMCAIPFKSLISFQFERPVADDQTTSLNLGNFLKEDRIILNMQSSTKEDAIKELFALLKNAPEVSKFENFVSDVFAREALCTTGIGNYLAIPHARTEAVGDIVVALGTSQKGIDFGAFDKKPAKIVLLMGTPKDKGMNNYLKLLAHITRVFKKKKIQETIWKATSAKKIIAEIKKHNR